jgi:7-cyano-7-deazaguanine synthase
MPSPLAVVLLSGGLDSATTAAIAQADGFSVAALSIRYGQRHDVELRSAARVADALGITRRLLLTVDLRPIGGSSLTTDLPVPRDRPITELGADIPSTYVPARNTIFLSLALAWAETLGARDIFIGANALDYSGYPDCRPAYLRAFEAMANLATRAGIEGRGVTIHAPLLTLTKAEIIGRGTRLGLDYGLTVSCYDPASNGAACGHCDACLLRRRGFETSGTPDPTRYQP